MKRNLYYLTALGLLFATIVVACGVPPSAETSVPETATLTEAPPTETQPAPTPTDEPSPTAEDATETASSEDVPSSYEFTEDGIKLTVESHEDSATEHQDWCPDPTTVADGTWKHYPPNKVYVRIEFLNVTYKAQMSGQISGSDYVLQKGWLVTFVTEDRSSAVQSLYCGSDVGIFLRITFG